MSGHYPLWWSLCFSWREISEFDISCIQVCLHFQQTQKHNSTRKVPRSPKSPKSSRSPTEEETERSSILQEFLDDHALLVRYGQGLSVAHAELNTLVEQTLVWCSAGDVTTCHNDNGGRKGETKNMVEPTWTNFVGFYVYPPYSHCTPLTAHYWEEHVSCIVRLSFWKLSQVCNPR